MCYFSDETSVIYKWPTVQKDTLNNSGRFQSKLFPKQSVSAHLLFQLCIHLIHLYKHSSNKIWKWNISRLGTVIHPTEF